MSLTVNGFDRPRLNDIKSDYDQRFIDALGPINTNADSVVGQIIGIFSAALDDAYEALQNTYDSMYPATAEGTSLDGAVSFVGLTRIGASPTTVVAACYGADSTLIPSGAIARALDNRQYITTSDAIISRSNAIDVSIRPISVLNNANYQIIAGGVSVVYTSDASATEEEIADGLAALFSSVDFIASSGDGLLRIRSADGVTGFTITTDSKLEIVKIGTPVVFTGIENGAYELPINALTVIDSALVGWEEVNNLSAGAIGSFVETDEELRIRHAQNIRVTGAATTQAIQARVLSEVDGVSFVSVYENRSNSVDAFNLPAHSFETIVSGGLDQSIADKIFEVKPAGIETYGNTAIEVIDKNGDVQICKFSRSEDKYAWIRVSIDELNPEETLSSDAEQAIKKSILDFSDGLQIGDDIITQKFYGPVYSSTNGIASITIEVALTGLITDTPVYTELNIPVERSEKAAFSESRIIVLGL